MEEQLFDAVYYNKLKEVKRLLENGTVSATVTRSFDSWTWSLAGRAVAEGHLNILKYLVNKEPSLLIRKTVEEDGVYQEGLLNIACKAGHFDIVKYLVEECNVDIFEESPRFGDDYNVMNPVYSAARGGHLEIFKYLLEKGNVDVNAPFRPRKDAPKDIKYPKSLLYLADRLKNPPKVLEYLLKETDIDVPATDEDGKSILFNKNIIRHDTILKIILDKYGDKFDINAKNDDGETLLHHFLWEPHTNLNFIRYLVKEKGANINIVDDGYKWTPLHFAADHDRSDVCKYLINRGASIDPKDKDGDTPLHITAIAGYINTCKILIKHGANMNQKNNKGDSPLHYAINGHYEKGTYAVWTSEYDHNRNAHQVFAHLVNCGANITQKNNEGKTPLDCLIAKGDLKGLKYLFRKGIIDVNKTRNENRESLVHLAVIYNQVPILDYLVRRKHAEIETTRSMEILNSYNFDTPLLTALRMKHYESSKYLIKHGADQPSWETYKPMGADKMIDRIRYELHSGRARRSIMPQSGSIIFQKQDLHKFNDYGSLVIEEANHSIEGIADPSSSPVTYYASQLCGFFSSIRILVSYISGSTRPQEPISFQRDPEDTTIEEAIYTLPDFEDIH